MKIGRVKTWGFTLPDPLAVQVLNAPHTGWRIECPRGLALDKLPKDPPLLLLRLASEVGSRQGFEFRGLSVYPS